MGDGVSIADSIKAINLKTPIASMAGIGPKRAEALKTRGIICVEDLLFHLPARYQDWRDRRTIAQLEPGTISVVEGTLSNVRERPMPGARWRRLVTAALTDGAGAQLRLVWFNLPSYMRGRMPDGLRVAAYGRVSKAADEHFEMVQPELRSEANDTAGPLRPVYRLPDGMPQRLYASLVAMALDQAAPSIKGAIPEPQREAASPSEKIATIAEALEYLHRPPADADLKELQKGRSKGHTTLAFDELFAFELAMCMERERSARRPGLELRGRETLTSQFIATIPFRFTGAQTRTVEEIATDLASARQMNRILIGDVGSGKTAVAFWAMLRAVESGAQAIMMAPTELLAEQHHRSFRQLCANIGKDFGVRSELLTGRIAGGSRKEILRDLQSGELQIVFGTQALIQQKVRVAKLGLGIVDEQHRFGVFDRAKLKALGAKANVLMMTATPIPRSLAMSLFANLDVSVLDELPPGRTPVKTEIFPEDRLDQVDAMVHEEIARGHRAYYVLPLIDNDQGDKDNEEELKTVTAMAARIGKGRLKDAGVGILHGRMKAAEKDRVMREFRDGIINVLISTTVVEVGIDVAEATVIAIIAAERYGLAQLHQLRGRVGRGRDASRCCLVMSRDADEAAQARVAVMIDCTTGNQVAQADLDLRGPGDLLGARQTGALPLRFLRFINDPMMIGRARAMAEAWLKKDAALASAASRGAKAAVRGMLAMGFSLADVG